LNSTALVLEKGARSERGYKSLKKEANCINARTKNNNVITEKTRATILIFCCRSCSFFHICFWILRVKLRLKNIDSQIKNPSKIIDFFAKSKRLKVY
jgi:hypothetical protein